MTRGPERLKGVLVDFDETLLDNSVVPATVQRACETVANVVHVDAAELLSANMETWREYAPTVERLWWLGEMDVLDVSREVGATRCTSAVVTTGRRLSSCSRPTR